MDIGLIYASAGYGGNLGIGGNAAALHANSREALAHAQQSTSSSSSPSTSRKPGGSTLSTPAHSTPASPSSSSRSAALTPSSSHHGVHHHHHHQPHHHHAAIASLLASVTSLSSSSGGGGGSRANSRASSRRSSIDHNALHEDSPHKKAVREAFIRKDVDCLRELSAKGFINDPMRRLVWPLLLGASADSVPPLREQEALRHRRRFRLSEKIVEDPDEEAKEGLIDKETQVNGSDQDSHKKDTEKADEDEHEHRDEYQVQLDVNRSFINYPLDDTRDRRRTELSSLIVTTLRHYPALNYFQGYHDIVSIILLVCDDDLDLASRLTARLSLFHIRDSMMSGLDPVVGYLRLLKRILAQADPVLSQAVEKASSLPYFSLSWVLTLMAHDLVHIELVSRIFDFLLAHNPIMVAYLCAALVMNKKSDVENLDPDIANDPATLHTVLSKLPSMTVDINTPAPSAPGSPTLRATRLAGQHSRAGSIAASERSFLDHEVDVPLLLQSIASASGLGEVFTEIRTSKRKTHRPSALVLEDLFTSALHLFELFPPSHPDIAADTIFGPLSATNTWEKHDLTEAEAEKIVDEGKDVVIPEPIERTKEEIEHDEELLRRRQLANRKQLAKMLARRNTTIFALVGLAGILLAIYSKDATNLLGARQWIQSSWFVRWVLAKK